MKYKIIYRLLAIAILIAPTSRLGAQAEEAADTAWDCATELLDGIDKFELLYRVNLAHQMDDYDPKAVYTVPLVFHVLGEDTQALSAVGIPEIRHVIHVLDEQLLEQKFVKKKRKVQGRTPEPALELATIKEHGSPRPAVLYKVSPSLARIGTPDLKYMNELSAMCLDPAKYLNVFVVQEITDLSATYCAEFNILLVDQKAFLSDPMWVKG